jgi:hypothetical protein
MIALRLPLRSLKDNNNNSNFSKGVIAAIKRIGYQGHAKMIAR